MSNNTTGCTHANVVPVKCHVNPMKLAVQPLGLLCDMAGVIV